MLMHAGAGVGTLAVGHADTVLVQGLLLLVLVLVLVQELLLLVLLLLLLLEL